MKAAQLREEIAVELDALARTVDELLALRQDITDREPNVREKTAAAAFLAQFYNGVENILKRISRYHNVPLPTGETWHIDLFQRFCRPSNPVRAWLGFRLVPLPSLQARGLSRLWLSARLEPYD
jgi:hypothetical protein